LDYPKSVSIIKSDKMKKIYLEKMEETFGVYTLSVEEMITVKGGDMGEPTLVPTPPPPRV